MASKDIYNPKCITFFLQNMWYIWCRMSWKCSCFSPFTCKRLFLTDCTQIIWKENELKWMLVHMTRRKGEQIWSFDHFTTWYEGSLIKTHIPAIMSKDFKKSSGLKAGVGNLWSADHYGAIKTNKTSAGPLEKAPQILIKYITFDRTIFWPFEHFKKCRLIGKNSSPRQV